MCARACCDVRASVHLALWRVFAVGVARTEPRVFNFCPGFRTFSSWGSGAIVSGPCKTRETARQSMFGFKGIDFKTDRWLYNVTV